MRKTLFCGVDIHSNNAMYVITDQEDQPVLKKRLMDAWRRATALRPGVGIRLQDKTTEKKRRVPQALLASLFLRNKGHWKHGRLF